MHLVDILAIYVGERYDGFWVSAHGISCQFNAHVSWNLCIACYYTSLHDRRGFDCCCCCCYTTLHDNYLNNVGENIL